MDIGTLVATAEALTGQSEGVGAHFCQAVERATQQRARLVLHPAPPRQQPRASRAVGARLWPVQFGGRTFGTLLVRPHDLDSTLPAIPDEQARELARLCGSLLHGLEHAALITVLSQQLPAVISERLTPRQDAVLQLLARGADWDEAAAILGITAETIKKHRQQLYARLGVHHTWQLLLAAHQAGHVSYVPPPHRMSRLLRWFRA